MCGKLEQKRSFTGKGNQLVKLFYGNINLDCDLTFVEFKTFRISVEFRSMQNSFFDLKTRDRVDESISLKIKLCSKNYYRRMAEEYKINKKMDHSVLFFDPYFWQ